MSYLVGPEELSERREPVVFEGGDDIRIHKAGFYRGHSWNSEK